MTVTPLYTYLGTNGTITSPVHLEGIYSVVKYRLEAAPDKVLVKEDGTTTKTIVVQESDIKLWKEVKASSK